MWQTAGMRGSASRLGSGIPAALTSATFLWAWIAPSTLGPQWVKSLILTMLIEFIVMHSSGLYAPIVAIGRTRRGTAFRMLGGLGVVYVLFVAGFAVAFGNLWPVAAFAWLFLSRFAHVWFHRDSASESASLIRSWVVSVLAYIGGAFITAVVALPALGLTPEFVASMHLRGGGVWIEHPQRALAFGFAYFAVQAWAQCRIAASGTNDELAGSLAAPSARSVR